MVSLIKHGISQKKIRPCQIIAKSVTGNELQVYGLQKVSVNTGDIRVYHDFIVADLETAYDGLMGVDLLKRLGLTIDFSTGNMYVREVQVRHRPDKSLPATDSVGQGPLPYSANGNNNLGKANSNDTWCVHTCEKLTVFPMTEMIVRGRLDNRVRNIQGNDPCNPSVTQKEIPPEVLIEPVELKVNGVRAARIISNVFNGDNNRREVVIKVINFSKEVLELPAKSLVGVAEAFVSETPDKVTTANRRSAITQVSSVKKSKKMFKSNSDSEIIRNLRDKLVHLSKNEYKVLWPVLLKYKRLFDEPKHNIGCKSNVKHRINTGDHPPIKKTPYRLPHALKPIVDEQIQDMCEKGIIRHSDSPWASPVVIVSKKSQDGSPKYRFCIDYRALNAITRGDAYPLPNIVETLDNLNGSMYFSTLDLYSGYHQVAMDPQDIEKTAFTIPGKHFEFVKMPFGLCNAPATFQRLMDNILMGIKGEEALVYLDDIIIYGNSIEQHTERLNKVLKRLEEANLYVQLTKCTFAVTEVEYLGHIVSRDGVKPDPKKIKSIVEYPQPKTVKDIRAFLGLTGYYRRFIKNFADIAKPMTELTKKEKDFSWGQSQQKAFETLRNSLCHEPVLRYPDFSKPFLLSTDASSVAIGAILSQMHNGQEHPVAYASRQLNKAERNYGATERELLALVWATKHFRCYLYGNKFTAITDHSALKWMLSLKDPSSRLTRWALRLSEFDYEVIHKPGKRHSNADALSRYINTVAIPFISKQDLIREQQYDTFCTKKRKEPDYKIDEQGLLYNIEISSTPRLVIPQSLVRQIIEHHHDTIFSGHQGVKRTVGILKERYYWQTLNKDVEEYISKCISCNQRKIGKQPKAPLIKIPPAREPFELVSMDIVGPLPVSNQGNKYLLTFIDYLTRYCEAIPIPNQTAEIVAKEFVHKIITRHGVPKKLLTDQGRNFVSSLFKGVCNLLGIKKIQTTPYHPQCNGLIERLHKSLADIISHFVTTDAREWDQVIPYALMAYRSAPNAATGFSPHVLLYGQEIRLPSADDLTAKIETDENIQYELEKLQQKLQKIREIAVRNSEISQHKNKEYYDRKVNFKKYKVGDYVFLRDITLKKGPHRKFSKNYKGPYQVIDVLNDVNYKIRINKNESVIVHYNRLKPSKVDSKQKRRVRKFIRESSTPQTQSNLDLTEGYTPSAVLENNNHNSDNRIALSAQTHENTQINANEEINEESLLQEITDIYDDQVVDDSIIQADPNDPEWVPPIQAETQVQSEYNLRSRETIVPPRRFE